MMNSITTPASSSSSLSMMSPITNYSNQLSFIVNTTAAIGSHIMPSSSTLPTSDSNNQINDNHSSLSLLQQHYYSHLQSSSSSTPDDELTNNSIISNLNSFFQSTTTVLPSPSLTSIANQSLNHQNSFTFHCEDGLILPCWYSDDSLQTMILHGVVYLFALIYMFVGVAIIADRFMSSIEQITSQERDIIVRRPDGRKEIVSVRIWNETVSNLTLMALGSSAPEILLSAIEIYAQNFEAGELGPGTIVGSAAFNMFVIIAICVWAVPSTQIKKIKYLRVFIITMLFSVFAYVWLLIILIWSSPGVIEVWEGLMTLFFFYLTVQLAYIADKRLLIYKYLDKHYRFRRNRLYESPQSKPPSKMQTLSSTSNEDGTGEEKMELNNVNGQIKDKVDQQQPPQQQPQSIIDPVPVKDGSYSAQQTQDNPIEMLNKNVKYIDASEEDLQLIEDHRENVIEILKDVYSRHPNATLEELEAIGRAEIQKLQPKSRAYYRMIAARRMLGSSTDLPNDSYSSRDSLSIQTPPTPSAKNSKQPDELEMISSHDVQEKFMIHVKFDPKEYTVMEDVGQMSLTVRRSGPDLDSSIIVHYRTEDGTAKAGTDYEPASGSIIFGPGESYKQIILTIINDDEFEEDEHFYVRLFDAKYASVAMDSEENQKPIINIMDDRARINILDDDHSGVFSFVNNVFQMPETIGVYRLDVIRYCGARGTVAVPYRTIPATAKPGEDFEMSEGHLLFHNNETKKHINLSIINNVNYEKNSIFYVELYEPHRRDQQNVHNELNERGAPRLGDLTKCMIRIRESKEFKQIVDSLMRRKKTLGYADRAGSWENQIITAVKMHKLSASSSLSEDVECSKRETLDGSKDEESDEGERTCCDYFIHYATFFWKIAFAFVPPATIWNGWACFLVSITMIGVLTALINDLASHFGATVHLKDSVTAISLVALGTSVPDTFASKIAAENEKNADSSVGNVTGSNAVNVFLGIGVAWTMAAIYHAIKGTQGGFQVEPGSLGFSVLLYCICAFICAAVLMIRRAYLGGELGGPIIPKITTVSFFVFLWLFYLIMSTLEAYGYIQGF
nr:sodium/calcium exchanger 3-like [Dermatophagoides farinae]XP_046914975.1 sodium/calcium exchanger 3-like [Dermatophagoides farinae]XP_046914982.1 sodium/calcium exchanger 3-like [Dermatophagoides farinae]XP_046914989.1 sodium/calcium exchanger 3-like [Dermatophagoides farinae]XP_046914997.1 sodium/calcium exchanger 3-like [Dermatophagoides farinae]XP_046915005.1 sodium/calcium exchanger 3-like [Dermatophagoides farinae]XP_046915013.1 sodium/calcium exchanger 3-like [Dermatophagoides farina